MRSCQVCHGSFQPRPSSVVGKRVQRFCSPACRGKAKNIRASHGLMADDLWAMWEAQGGVCGMPACDSPLLPFSGTTGCHVDHCHATGRVRGLLCHPCNIGLGHFESLFARGALEYLKGGDADA